MTVKEIAEEIRNSNRWDYDLCGELCKAAGMTEAWDQSDFATYKDVVVRAADKLGVDVLSDELKAKIAEFDDALRICLDHDWMGRVMPSSINGKVLVEIVKETRANAANGDTRIRFNVEDVQKLGAYIASESGTFDVDRFITDYIGVAKQDYIETREEILNNMTELTDLVDSIDQVKYNVCSTEELFDACGADCVRVLDDEYSIRCGGLNIDVYAGTYADPDDIKAQISNEITKYNPLDAIVTKLESKYGNDMAITSGAELSRVIDEASDIKKDLRRLANDIKKDMSRKNADEKTETKKSRGR